MAAIVEAARVEGKLASWRSTQVVWDVVHFPGYFRVQIRGLLRMLNFTSRLESIWINNVTCFGH
jgi:hypothetical protein